MLRALVAALAAIFFLAGPAAAGPNDIVLIFANETYVGSVPKAGFAHRDGEEMRRAARDVLAVPESRIIVIKDATSGTFQDWVESGGGVGPVLAQLPIRRDSTIYVYYSGHGMPARKSGASEAESFLLPVDTPPAQVARRGLAVSDLRAALAAVQKLKAPDGRVVLWLDACFTGSSGGGDLVSDSRSVRISTKAIMAAEPKLVEIAAASFEQEALWDAKRGHGVFTDTLLDGLYGAADADKDGHVTADELHRFLVDHVEERVARLFPSPRRFQTPMLLGDRSIRIASVTGAVRDPALRAEMQIRCSTTKASSDISEIRAFLSDCGPACPCRADLQKRIGELERSSSTCIGEGRELARLEKL
ncbi:MAG TPA: caspase family protein, partial [Hyphomicrobiaceae bacterium]|nr:caspase family protein [Hyphomicrobiaceae bacterium]